jgi:hypothetical protein
LVLSKSVTTGASDGTEAGTILFNKDEEELSFFVNCVTDGSGKGIGTRVGASVILVTDPQYM